MHSLGALPPILYLSLAMEALLGFICNNYRVTQSKYIDSFMSGGNVTTPLTGVEKIQSYNSFIPQRSRENEKLYTLPTTAGSKDESSLNSIITSSQVSQVSKVSASTAHVNITACTTAEPPAAYSQLKHIHDVPPIIKPSFKNLESIGLGELMLQPVPELESWSMEGILAESTPSTLSLNDSDTSLEQQTAQKWVVFFLKSFLLAIQTLTFATAVWVYVMLFVGTFLRETNPFRERPMSRP